MSIAQSMLPEFENEMANTRRTLERVPEDKFEWKPDPKSMSLGRLASHVVEMVGWGAMTLQTESLDLSPDMKPFVASSRNELLEQLDKNIADARAALETTSDADMMKNWSLTMGGQPFLSMPKAAVFRGMIMNHIIHHRAQLTVYYRMNGVPVPALYGPSADEGSMAAAG